MADAARGKGFGDERYRALIAALVKIRTDRGLSQQAVADLLGRHQQFVSRYEIGERRLDVIEFVDVARILGADPADLIKSV
ncbi:helix-turn-helix domain-containing protein [uncultured Sphingomonas sp.]|uniref:helix-turn-helix domain-containing protein n=1 Tax=uncultured Sphingomonas sp. TaxID=158754 RepID=UPI003747B2CA